MALMFEYKPGMNLSDPWPFTVVRSQPGYRITVSGTLEQEAANILRDNHYVGGVRTTLFEPSAINRLLQSQTWGTTPWSNNVATLTNNQGTAPDGTNTASKVLPNNTGANNNPYAVQGGIAITSGEFLAYSLFIKANGYNAVVLRCSDAPSTNGFQVSFDLATGSFGTSHVGFGAGTITGWTSIPLANGWYWVGLWGSINAAITSATVFCYVYPNITMANAQTAYTADGTSSILGWGAQVERNGTTFSQAPTSYLPTTTGASSARGADTMSISWPFRTMPMWSYVSFYDLGMCQRAQSAFFVTMTANPAADPQWVAAFGGVSSDVRSSWISGAGAGGVGNSNRNTCALTTVNPVYGDFVEMFSRVFADGSTALAARRNGGAITTTGPIGPLGTVPFVDIASPMLLVLGYPSETIAPLIGLTCIKIGADPTRITALEQGAAA